MSDKKMSEYLWRDCKSDQERADFILCGRACETGVIAPSIQSEVAMAFQRLATLAARPPCGTDVADAWREIVEELVDDLESELAGRYPEDSRHYPSQNRRYERDMAVVRKARAMLASQPAAPVAPATVAVPVPDGVVVAFGLLWHVRMGCDFPVPQGFSKNISPEEAAAKARRFLSDLLTQEQKGDGINRASELLAASQREGGGT